MLERGNGVRDVSLWKEVLGIEKTVIESVEYDQEQDLLVARVGDVSNAPATSRSEGPLPFDQRQADSAMTSAQELAPRPAAPTAATGTPQ
jgi:hypothetical protein